MMTFIPRRLRKPAVWALAGVAGAVAWAVRGGPTWWFAILVGVVTVVQMIATYVRAGTDTDEGALAGSRADERLALVTARSRGLAGTTAAIAAFIGMCFAIAMRATWFWPFGIIFGVLVLGYLFGLSNYGFGDEGPAEDGMTGQRAPSRGRR